MSKQSIGKKLRQIRLGKQIPQVHLAKTVGVSPTYLNLIEHGHRPVGEHLLIKLAAALDIDPAAVGARSVAWAEMVATDPLVGGVVAADELAALEPNVAQAIARLYRGYLHARESAETLATRIDQTLDIDEVARARLPSEEVSQFLQDRQNFVPELEAAAEALWQRADLRFGDLYHRLMRFVGEHLDMQVTMVRAASAGRVVRRFDADTRVLQLSEALPMGSRIFQISHQAALLLHRELLSELATDTELTTEDSRALCRVALANYFAAAVVMPYQPFLSAAKEERYDIDLLQNRFGANFEQVCHRLTTLRSGDGGAGVPFHFVRIDLAGNVSKRFSASGMTLSRFGACPRWSCCAAFLTPGRIITQLERMPDGSTYFCVARTVAREARGYHVPAVPHAIVLGCRVEHATHLVYAEGVDLENLDAAVSIGTSCRLCERLDCAARAFPSVRHPLRINENVRGISFYGA